MSAKVTVQWHGPQWISRVYVPAAGDAVYDTAGRGVTIVQESMKRGAGPSAPGSPPHSHHGIKGLVGTITRQKGSEPLTALVGTGAISARIHEFGGTIRPKKQKALCIPLNEAARSFAQKRGGGVKAYTAAGGGPVEGTHMRGVLLALMFQYNGNRDRRGRFQGAKTGKRFVFKSSGKGKGGVWGVVSRGGGRNAPFIESEPKFLITKRVVIPARPFMRPLITNPANRATLMEHFKRVMDARVKARSIKGAA